jgi:hypothetical protein
VAAHEQWIRQLDRGEAAAATQVAHAPDFARHDRGDEDDHWLHAMGALCERCGALIEEGDFVRRRAAGGWQHEDCDRRPAPVQTL